MYYNLKWTTKNSHRAVVSRYAIFRTESAVQSSRGQALGDYVPCRMRPEKAIHCSPRFYIGSIILTAAVRRGYILRRSVARRYTY